MTSAPAELEYDIAAADFTRAGVSLDKDLPVISDASDFLFYAALAVLPIDGTIAGPYMPFWTPLSPWMFLAYALMNWRSLPQVWRRFRAFFLFPVLLVGVSLVGWLNIAFHKLAALTSLAGIVGALACLVALDMALRVKRLSWKRMLDVIIATYWFAFAMGVMQRLAISLDVESVRNYFVHLMSRQYLTTDSKWGGGRPQFLFAEPSYIGMHLYGVLLPMIWMVRGRDRKRAARLRVLVAVFAIGSVAMGAGVRIILDSIIAVVIVIIESADWESWRGRLSAIVELIAAVGVGAGSMLLNHRLSRIAELGFDGDGSFYARLWQSMGPLAGTAKHPLRLLLGYGAGNLSDATHQGANTAVHVLQRLGLDASQPSRWYTQVTSANMFTMSAYTSFIVEFGAVACVILLIILLRHITSRHAWRKTIVCWLILVSYLYAQFEGYAFYALPLLVWATSLYPERECVSARHKRS